MQTMDHDLPSGGEFGEYTFKEFPLMFFSHDAIMRQAEEHRAVYYVWPDEGEFKKTKFHFHKGNRPQEFDSQEPTPYPETPLLIDAQSANAYKVCWNAMSEKNQNSCREKCESARWWAAYIISEVFWKSVSYGGR